MGYDYAGVVEAVGEEVTRLKPGDAVVGIVNPVDSRNAAMAERVCATEALATVKPPSLSFADGASLPGAGITAVQALREAGLAAGQRVLVVGAAGGVGSFAVQYAKIGGAHVTAVASAGAQDFLAGSRPTAPSTTPARTGRRSPSASTSSSTPPAPPPFPSAAGCWRRAGPTCTRCPTPRSTAGRGG